MSVPPLLLFRTPLNLPGPSVAPPPLHWVPRLRGPCDLCCGGAESCRDLDSLLPESPFSSPKRGKGAAKQGSPLTAPGPGASVLRSSAGSGSRRPSPPAPRPRAHVLGLRRHRALTPNPPLPIGRGSNGRGRTQGRSRARAAMMPHGAGLHELTHGMAYLAVAPSPPHTNSKPEPLPHMCPGSLIESS